MTSELRARYDQLAARAASEPPTFELASELRDVARQLEQAPAPAPDYARALPDRARAARALAERVALLLRGSATPLR